MNRKALTLSLGSSNPGESTPDSFLKGRLLSFQGLLKELSEDVDGIQLPGQCKPAQQLVVKAIDILVAEVKETTDELALLSSPENRSRRARDLYDSLEQFVHFRCSSSWTSRVKVRAM